jgi:hypothetical protein
MNFDTTINRQQPSTLPPRPFNSPFLANARHPSPIMLASSLFPPPCQAVTRPMPWRSSDPQLDAREATEATSTTASCRSPARHVDAPLHRWWPTPGPHTASTADDVPMVDAGPPHHINSKRCTPPWRNRSDHQWLRWHGRSYLKSSGDGSEKDGEQPLVACAFPQEGWAT